MRIQTKIFYADLFSKSPSPAPGAKPRPAPAVLKPMAPLAPALSSKAPPQSITAQLITARQKTPEAEVKKDSVAALPVLLRMASVWHRHGGFACQTLSQARTEKH